MVYKDSNLQQHHINKSAVLVSRRISQRPFNQTEFSGGSFELFYNFCASISGCQYLQVYADIEFQAYHHRAGSKRGFEFP
jgi:hypothetical protein